MLVFVPLVLMIPSGFDANTGMQIPANEWTHVAFTVDEGNIHVYVNGMNKFSGAGFPNVFTSTNAAFALGVNYWDLPYKGLMDELLYLSKKFRHITKRVNFRERLNRISMRSKNLCNNM